ncbi:glycoside hydrolase family 88/105 protein [[Clostridium] fimetarium]|uniref:Unsaturated rhamnogalacturonyl hydrolase n=1 Tax=[Clostridium] fimetarium TaxID=99656 RepID=A0A1I0MD95_9FIRM|nr:glycoside hydrolase family 88 protein [[Clostridium] fimetarium]SEV86343.1 unsaturated rhamnogalacturonyl hydrolase [[Clostridium] fimetarium]
MNNTNEKVEKFIKEYIDNFKSAKDNKWNYEDGCVLKSAIMMYEVTAEEYYKKFILDYLKKYINEDGSINFYNNMDYNIDNVSTGTVLFFAYEETGDEKYRTAIENIMDQLRKQPRTEAGNFWHKMIYPNQVWLDGLYMGQVFYMQYETKFGGKEHYNDIISQFKNVRKYIFNEEKGLYYHAYDSLKEQPWANKETGVSPNHWLRAIGWYLLAIIDTMSVMEQPIYEYYRELQSLFKEAIAGVLQYQDKETGLFYQIVDKADAEGNYLETSGSVKIAYAILKACRMKVLLSEKYEDNAFHILNSLIDTRLEEVDKKLQLGGICGVAGLGGKEKRDGTLKYYFNEPVIYDDHKGVGPFIMAYSESLRIKK